MGDEKGTIYHISKVPIRDYLINWVPFFYHIGDLESEFPSKEVTLKWPAEDWNSGYAACELFISGTSVYRNISWTNATNVSIHPPRQVIWGRIWKHTVEKSQTNVTYVTLHPLVQTIWGDIWRRTLEESYTSATNVDLPPLRQALWGDIWKCTVGKSRRWDSYLQIACKNADYLRRKGILWICFYGTIFAKKSNRKSNPIFPILSDFFRFLDFSRLPDFPIQQL